MAYTGIRGLGRSKTGETTFTRTFPAMFILMYWDTYKNYYANKQEDIGYVITQGRYARSGVKALFKGHIDYAIRYCRGLKFPVCCYLGCLLLLEQ